MFVLTIWKGLVFQPAVYTLLQTGSIFFFFPQEARWEPQEDKTSMTWLEENDNTN